MKRKELFAIIGLFLFGIVFRLWFVSLAPQPYWYDQTSYGKYALRIYNHPYMLASHSYRSYPLPLLMASVYKLFGLENHYAVFVVQAVLDSLTGVMVYLLLKKGFRMRKGAWVGGIMYIVNPFTSAYVGVLLSEILTAFFMAATFFFGMYFIKRPTMLLGILMGLGAGMAAETRNAVFVWAAVPLVLLLTVLPWKKHRTGYTGVLIGLFLTILYPLITNWRDYRELSITKVDSFYAMEFFNGASLRTQPPFNKIYPYDNNIMWLEYYTEDNPWMTKEDRRAMAQKYLRKGWEIIRADPVDYIKMRFFKMWYVWQKENVFFYVEPGFESHKQYTYALNLVLLSLGALGLATGRVLARGSIGKWVWASMLGSVVYATLSLSLSHGEYRLTIPFYPMVIALGAMGIEMLRRALHAVRRTK